MGFPRRSTLGIVPQPHVERLMQHDCKADRTDIGEHEILRAAVLLINPCEGSIRRTADKALMSWLRRLIVSGLGSVCAVTTSIPRPGA